MATEPTTKAAERPPELDALYRAGVVVARARSLQPLQALCHRNDGAVATVLTARYRLRSGPVFGTLLAAFAADMWRLRHSGDRPRGDLMPAPGLDEGSLWRRLLTTGAHWAENPMPEAEVTTASRPLAPEWVETFFATLRDEDALPRHMRLILLCEVEQGVGPEAEYRDAVHAVRDRLPRNVTIVVSDAPHDWRPSPDDPRTVEIPAPAAAAGDDRDAGEEMVTFAEAALSGDQPADVDRLGVAPLADGLARLLMLEQTRPLTVGVQAPWGWGKSSFVGFVRDALIRRAPRNVSSSDLDELERIDDELAGLEQSTKPDRDIAELRRQQSRRRTRLLRRLEKRARRHVICVPFNAWRYEGSEQVWAGLARAITKSLEDALSPAARVASRVDYAIRRHGLQFWLGFVVPVALAILASIVAILVGVADAGEELSDRSGRFALIAVPVATVLIVGWRFLRVIQPISARIAGMVEGPDYAARVGFQNEVIDDLTLLRRHLRGEPRVVVLVDDLDRCGDESIMETLQAINLVLGASNFFVVLAIDPDMIHRAIARQRGLADDSSPAHEFAENYLRKIIQLPLHLPGRTADQRFDFVSRLFSPAAQREFQLARAEADGEAAATAALSASDAAYSAFRFSPALVVPPRVPVLRKVEDTKEEIAAVEEFKDQLDDNPRELKRLVNVHRLVKILLQRPDAPPTVDAQRKLVAWLVYCANADNPVEQVLRDAAADPDADTCVVTVGELRLSARDLAADGTLARAARISQLVRDERDATPQPLEAEPDPTAPPAASPS